MRNDTAYALTLADDATRQWIRKAYEAYWQDIGFFLDTAISCHGNFSSLVLCASCGDPLIEGHMRTTFTEEDDVAPSSFAVTVCGVDYCPFCAAVTATGTVSVSHVIGGEVVSSNTYNDTTLTGAVNEFLAGYGELDVKGWHVSYPAYGQYEYVNDSADEKLVCCFTMD